uniref:Carbon-nitrogen hydrolase family protein n=1 Tax=Ammonifex degensii TaxID=42838 RepID=A0A7C1J823_9THEO
MAVKPPSRFCVAICQLKVGPDKRENLARAQEFIHRAARQGAKVVVLPEMFVCPYVAELFPSYAESYPGGEALQMLSRTARAAGVYLVGGSIPEREGERLYNASFVFDPAGKLIARHRKVHLFDVDLPGGFSFRESATLTPGRGFTVFSTDFGTVGLAICFDIRFPAFFQAMARHGAEVIVVPGAFNLVTGPAHWELLLRARAVDNQVYTVGAAPARNPASAYVAFGHSMVVSPWAEVVARAGPQETILLAEIDRQYVRNVRQKLRLLAKKYYGGIYR